MSDFSKPATVFVVHVISAKTPNMRKKNTFEHERGCTPPEAWARCEIWRREDARGGRFIYKNRTNHSTDQIDQPQKQTKSTDERTPLQPSPHRSLLVVQIARLGTNRHFVQGFLPKLMAVRRYSHRRDVNPVQGNSSAKNALILYLPILQAEL